MITTSLKRSRSLLNKVLPIDIEGDKHSSPSVVTRSSPILNHDSESLHLNKRKLTGIKSVAIPVIRKKEQKNRSFHNQKEDQIYSIKEVN